MGQAGLLADLRARLAAKEVLVVVGTGVSIQASGGDLRASWDGLIGNGIDFAAARRLFTDDEADELRAKLADGQRIDVAQRIADVLRGGDFRQWLRESVGTLAIRDREIIDAVGAIGAPLATTNYDDLLSRGLGIAAVAWTDVPAALEIVRRGRRAVLHFHGRYDEPDSVVLGAASYENVLRSRGAQAIQQAVASLRTLLFIGCGDGLSDPNFGALLAWSESILGDSIYHHYALCRNGEAKPAGTQLKFIEYGGRFDELPAFLRRELAGSHPTRLPASGFCFGRTAEVRAVVSALLRKKPKPTPILGGPGVGKTTIALHAMHSRRVAERFGRRRFFVHLDGAKRRIEVAAAIALALDISVSPNVEQLVCSALEEAPAAIILDNAETPLQGDRVEVEKFLAVLSQIEGLALVVTIRGTNRPHTVAWGKTIEVEKLADGDARTLFLAASGKKAFQSDPVLPQLLEVLDGVPLALTLMAHYAESFGSLASVWQRWDDRRTSMLKDGTVKDRLHDVEVSFELSIEVLSDDARRLLSVMALLPDGVALRDLNGVFREGDDAALELRQRALIAEEENRLRMRAPLREYMVRAHRPQPADEQRVVLHYLALAAQEGAKLGSAGGGEAVVRLSPEVANVDAMLAHLPDVETQVAIDAVYGWAEFIRFSGIGSESGIARARQRALADDVLPLAARCAASLGDVALIRSDAARAEVSYEEALALYRRLGDRRGEANCIRALADVARSRSNNSVARQRYHEGLALSRELGYQSGEANCIKGLGVLAYAESDYAPASAFFEQALLLYREEGKVLGEGNCVKALADIALLQARHDEARSRYDDALVLLRRAGDLLGQANCIKGLGHVALAVSDHDAARPRYEEAILLFRKIGDLRGEANCIRALGEIDLERDDFDGAAKHCRQALPLFARVGDVVGQGNCYYMLGNAALERGQPEQARAHQEEALALYRSVEHLLGEANCTGAFGDIAIARREYEAARAYFNAALPMYRSMSDRFGEGHCLMSLGEIAAATSDPAEAVLLYRRALEIYEAVGEPYSVGEAHLHLAKLLPDPQRMSHLNAARVAWTGIKRDDLVARLDAVAG